MAKFPGFAAPNRSGPERQFRSPGPGVPSAPVATSISPATGRIGTATAVTITGLNFILDGTGANIWVTIGGFLATSVVVVDRQTITCNVPVGTDAGAVDVVIGVNGATDARTATLYSGFTYFESTIIDVLPSAGPLTGGTVVMISGRNFITGATINFGGTPATDITFIDSEHYQATVPNHAVGFVTVSITDTSGTFELKNAFQYTLLTRGGDIRRQPGVTVHDTLSNTPNTCSLVVDGKSAKPKLGERIEILDTLDGDRRLFGGIATSVQQDYQGQINQLIWTVSCSDYTALLNTKRPHGTYINISCSDIIIDLFAKGYAPRGFTTHHVQTKLAKVSIHLDGSKTWSEVLSLLATAIGGGHWKVDYDMDLHFFHRAPTSTLVPAGLPAATSNMTIAEDTITTSTYDRGFLLARHTFLYDDGTESSPQSVSNLLSVSGTKKLAFTGVPLGANPGSRTCVGRRIYYNKFITGYPGGEAIEKLHPFVQINDNTTTAFTVDGIGAINPTVAAVVSFTDGVSTPIKTYPTPSVSTPAGFALLSNQAAAILLSGNVSRGTYGVPGFVSAPTAGSAADSGQGFTVSDFVPGDSIKIAFAAFNQSGSTDLSPAATYTFSAYATIFVTDPRITCPALPSGATGMNYYLSVDGGTNYKLIGAASVVGGSFQLPNITKASIAAGAVAPPSNTARVISFGWVGYNGVTQIPEAGPFPASGTPVAYFATTGLAALLENQATAAMTRPPLPVSVTHPPGPSTVLTASADALTNQSTGWNGTCIAFKVAYLYRDGSVSYAGQQSNIVRVPHAKGTVTLGYNLSNIPIGPAIGTLDVIARFIYFCFGQSQDPSFSVSGIVPTGFVWPIPFNDPDWSKRADSGIFIINDNTTTQLLKAATGDLGYADPYDTTYTGQIVGRGNNPYDAAGQQLAISVDPIPIWPNPDGPSLEDSNPPDDIDDANPDLLHADSGSQPFSVMEDWTQIRNRVKVIGAGSIVPITANVGDTQVQVTDFQSFSPNGGTAQYEDRNGVLQTVKYNFITGVVGQAYLQLTSGLTVPIPQGAILQNFFQADDIDSQKALAKVEVDAFGNATDGVHEYVIVDTSLKALFQLYMRAHAELELFSKPIVTVRYATRDPKSVAGQMVHVDLTDPPCQGGFLIQDVTIDQFHDESDDLSPRYTVTACSSRFELNDLLLQLLGNTSVNGGSSAGVASAATTAAQTDAATAIAATQQNFMQKKSRRRQMNQYISNIGDNSTYNSTENSTGVTSVNGGGGTTHVDSVDGPWVRYFTTTIAGANQGMGIGASSFTWAWPEHNPLLEHRVKVRNSFNNTNQLALTTRFYCGFWNSAPALGSGDQHTRKYFGVRCNGADGEGNLAVAYSNGTTETVGATIVSNFLGLQGTGTDAAYRIRIWISDGGLTFNVQINDGTIYNTPVPSALLSVTVMPICQFFCTTAQQLESYFGEWTAERDN